MSDWQVGDLAVCVDASPNKEFGDVSDLVLGRTYTVTRVLLGGLGIWVREADHTDYLAFRAARFRKIRPDTTEAGEKCEQLLTFLKRQPAEHILGLDGDD